MRLGNGGDGGKGTGKFLLLRDRVSQKGEFQVDFEMNHTAFKGGRNRWIPTIFSNTLIIFYLSLLATLGIVIYFLMRYKPIPAI